MKKKTTKPNARKNKKQKTNTFNKIEFRSLKQLKTTILNAVNKGHDNPILRMSELNKLFTKKNTKKSKTKGYTFNKAQRRVNNYLVKKHGINLTQQTQININISKSGTLKLRKKDILDNWELAKNDKTYTKALDYLIKINNNIEINNYDIFRHAKIITDTFGRSYTFSELIKPGKNFINNIRNHLINIDFYKLKYFANKKNLQKLQDIIIEKFLDERTGQIGQFYFNFNSVDWTQNKKVIKEQLDDIKAYYFDKTGQTEVEYTKYFEITGGYADSENLYVTSFKIKNEYALKELRDLYNESQEKFYQSIFNDLAEHQGLFESLQDALKGDLNAGYDHLGEQFDSIKADVKHIVKNIKFLEWEFEYIQKHKKGKK